MNTKKILLTLIILGTLLRLLTLSNPSIRSDEGATIQLASQDWNNYMDAVRGDVHPPLFYRYLHIFTFTDSAFILRLAIVIPSTN